MPSHTHTGVVRASSERGAETSPSGNVLADDAREDQYVDAAPIVSMAANTVQIANTGGNQAFNIMQPYQVINFQIALTGLFPSRT
jgi:microcystin-dependent protein